MCLKDDVMNVLTGAVEGITPKEIYDELIDRGAFDDYVDPVYLTEVRDIIIELSDSGVVIAVDPPPRFRLK